MMSRRCTHGRNDDTTAVGRHDVHERGQPAIRVHVTVLVPVEHHGQHDQLIACGVGPLQLQPVPVLTSVGRDGHDQGDAGQTRQLLCLALISPDHERFRDHENAHLRLTKTLGPHDKSGLLFVALDSTRPALVVSTFVILATRARIAVYTFDGMIYHLPLWPNHAVSKIPFVLVYLTATWWLVKDQLPRWRAQTVTA